METMKFYTEEEILDKHIGKKGTPKRDQFEADLNSFLIGEAIKQARQSKNLTQEELGNLIGPLNWLRKALILALNDSAEAFVNRSSK